MSFTIYTSNRMELLVEYLAQVLNRQPLPPLVPETIVVQSQGMARWLSMELAGRLGVWANGSFPFPNAFLRQVFEQVIDDEMTLDAWQRPVLAWRIMALFPEFCDDDRFGQVAAYVTTPLKAYQLAAALADLFDQYVIYRPDFISSWEQGGEPDFWQAILWRRLRDDIAQPHRADLFDLCLERLKSDQIKFDTLPSRVSVFGVSSMPPRHLEVFHALTNHAEVNVFFLNPCDKEWGHIIPEAAVSRLERDSGLDRQSHFLDIGNPLLASMGRLGRDFFSLLLGSDAQEQALFVEPGAGSLLAAVQTDILKLQDAANGCANDDSICFASCHSPIREVEVLHDHLLGLFSNDDGLEPRDVLVMAPDISAYAPLVEAVFSSDGDQVLPYTIADQSHDQEECIAGFFQILALSQGRFKAIDVVALLEIAALRRRFRLGIDDVDQISQWLAELRICWGRDGKDRARFGLPEYEENTWQAGLDRLLLGFAMDDEQFFAGILPYENAHLEPDLAGRFLSFYHTLNEWAGRLQKQYDLSSWGTLLLQLTNDMLLPDQDEEREMQVLRSALAALSEEQDLSHFTEEMGLDVVQHRIKQAVSRDLSPYGFMGGGITFCSLLPMRAVPFKVICLLGMNDDDFPRSPARFGFDLMAKEFRRGDRSMRFDDRYLFLEAVLSARQQLYISFQGRSVLDDSELAPSVLVRELMEYVARLCSREEAAENDLQERLKELVVQHHLQPFHPDYFQGGASSFSENNFRAAQKLVESEGRRVDFKEGLPLADTESEKKHIDLNSLQRFWQSPSRYFCEQRLGLLLESEEGPLVEDEPFNLKGLDRYTLNREMVEGILSRKPLFLERVKATGILPHGAMAEAVFDKMQRQAGAFVKKVKELGGHETSSHTGTLVIGDFLIDIELTHVNSIGQFHYRFGKVDGRHLLRAWLNHLALNSLDMPATMGRQTVLIADDAVIRMEPLDKGRAVFRELLEFYRQGLVGPLPFFAKASWVYAEFCHQGKEYKAVSEAEKTLWGSEFKAGEWQWDPYLQRCFPVNTVLGEDFGVLSQAVYGPLLEVMEKEQGVYG